MLHIEDPEIYDRLFCGKFGLEKENLRILGDGTLSLTAHPAPGDRHIVRDFSENQIEINTSPHDSVEEALAELVEHETKLQTALSGLPEHEYLWQFSNPPYIRSEEDIPVAEFFGEEASKTEYRKHLAEVYGRYKMTFSGIHVNYSFDDGLLDAEAKIGGASDFRTFKDSFYVDLAEKLSVYGWILVMLTAASPVTDISFDKPGSFDEDIFIGKASLRCSEYGYWNFFTPVLDYTDIRNYADSIERYVDSGKLDASTELYYPIRLKPAGVYDVRKLKTDGADHIELRMYDLDPLVPEGIEVRDVEFARLFMIYLASLPGIELDNNDQMHAVQNFKEAARYELSDVRVVMPGCRVVPACEEASKIMEDMRDLFASRPEALDIIWFEEKKIKDKTSRYAYKVLNEYGTGYVKRGIELAKKRQADILGNTGRDRAQV